MKNLAQQRYDEAYAHDRAGREAEAIPCYEEALELGLPDPLRQQALLGPLAKYAAAFWRISFSSSTRRNSRFNLTISACSSRVAPTRSPASTSVKQNG